MSDAELREALRTELIQVAAVACAIVEDLDYGESNFAAEGRNEVSPRGLEVIAAVAHERRNQDNKWGPQHYDPTVWLAILGEEFGEACQAGMRLTNQAVREKDLADDR